jgi:acetate kinase
MGEALKLLVTLDNSGRTYATFSGRTILHAGLPTPDEQIDHIGIKVAIPGGYFLEDRIIDTEFDHHLALAHKRTPDLVGSLGAEIERLRDQFPKAVMVAISDSAFHITKPDYAWNYGISLRDADEFDIKRFGFHGLAVAASIHTLRAHEKLPPRVVVCCVGDRTSVSAVYHGRGFDTTTGFSPTDGLMTGSSSGSVDPQAVLILKQALGLDDKAMMQYLQTKGGLLGLSGTMDTVFGLLEHEQNGHHHASLALQTYVYNVQKAIGQMTAALGGIDVLVFTGHVAEASSVIRDRIVERLHHLDFLMDGHANRSCTAPTELTCVSRLAHSKPMFVIPADEDSEMIRRLNKL